ncbi:MAG: Flp pilus assembly complex ATPase component, partial [bacterium]|nr:Flp pilus assembly complex ATPase component [bacterium]
MGDYDNELSRIVEQLNQAVSSPAPGTTSASTSSLEQLLAVAAKRGASDLLLIAGNGPVMRIHGELTRTAGGELSAEDVRNLVLPLLEASQYEELQRRKAVDVSFVAPAGGRFRINIHYQRGSIAASIRLLPGRIPTIESLELPAVLAELCARRQGLVLVTGPTGCGKSTTLAAMVDRINQERRAHIVTIEDPIEFEHANRNSVIEQIEVGRDTPDFAGTVRSVLRQSPDVILVGEMRDAETISTVLTAAETGHL